MEEYYSSVEGGYTFDCSTVHHTETQTNITTVTLVSLVHLTAGEIQNTHGDTMQPQRNLQRRNPVESQTTETAKQ